MSWASAAIVFGLLLLLVNVAAKAELAAQHNVLRDKAALFSATIGATANWSPS